MENERLARAIARIEQAAVALDNVGPLTAPASEPADDATIRAELDSQKVAHQATLDERERTIAKLRADLADISNLKDEEIERLRGKLQNRPEPQQSGVSEADHQTLQQKYDRLRATAESTLAGLDGLIEKTGRADNG